MQDAVLMEDILSSETLFEGRIFTVDRLRVTLPEGGEAVRDIVRHAGAAAIVPVDEGGNVTLVRQCRVAAGRVTLEIPAGKLDKPDEEFLACAKRELSEETGQIAAHWRLLTTLYTSPGFCTERIGVYLATGLSAHEAHPDQDEFVQIVAMPLREAVARVTSGEISDAKTVVGLLLASLALRA